MPTLKQKIEKLKADHAIEVKDETAKLKALALFKKETGLTPTKRSRAANMNYDPITSTAYRADFWLWLEAETLEDALTMAEKLNPVLLEKNGRYAGLMPGDTMPEDEKESLDKLKTAPWYYVIDTLKGYPDKKKLILYVDLEETRFKVEIKVFNDPLTRTETRYISFLGGTRRDRTTLYNESGHFAYSQKLWASEDSPNSFNLY